MNTEFLFSPQTVLEIIIIVVMYLISTKIAILFLLLLFLGYALLWYVICKSPTKITQDQMKSVINIPFKNDFFKFTHTKVPRYSSNEVLISVKAASINPIDYKVNFTVFPFFRWFKTNIIGYDVCGVVVEVGTKVTSFQPGDVVYGGSRSGSLAEYAACRESEIALVPQGINVLDIVGAGLVGNTSFQALTWFFKPEELSGKRVLVIGGSGGVGSVACQILKYYNATVYGVCSSKNINYVQGIADHAIDYTGDIKNQLNGINFDLIFDSVTAIDEKDQRPIYQDYLVEGGKYVQINGKSLDFLKGIVTSFIYRSDAIEEKNFHLHALQFKKNELEIIANIIKEGKLIVKHENHSFSYEDIKLGFDTLKSRRTVGKIVFEINTSTNY